jgi:hypothetical protein
MKMSPALFDWLRTEIARHDTGARRAAYREGRYPRAERTRDLDLRYRWDLLWTVHGALPGALRAELNDLSDSHIDTALRRIVAQL